MAEGNKHTGGDAMIVTVALKAGRTAVMLVMGSTRCRDVESRKKSRQHLQSQSVVNEKLPRRESKMMAQEMKVTLTSSQD